MKNWTECKNCLPPEGEVVQTMISDAKGTRNEQELIRSGKLWFLKDKSMYVYYTPTHWKSK